MKKLIISLCLTIASIIVFAGCCSAASMSYDNGTLTIENMSNGGLVVQASYDGNGVLESVKLHDDVHNGENELTANEGDRLFLWNGTKTMKPECTVIVVGSVNAAEPVTEPKSDTNNILMVYFSHAGENWQVGTIDKGNTAEIADYILENVDADVFEIKATDPYPVSYNETLTRVNRERDNNERPSFEGKIENLDQYDAVFIGYPIWYGGLPMIMYTFLEEYDLGDKMIIPFSTHGGSGWGSTKSELAKLIPNGKFVDGYSIAGTEARKDTTKEAVKKWLEGIELPKRAETQEDMAAEPVSKKETGEFDLEKGIVKLNSGYDMPLLGIGTYLLSNTQAENSVYWALRDGYRLIDTARIYGNEEGVGRGIKKAIAEGFVTREEIFVTTKMWTSDFNNGAAAIQGSLSRLGLDYIDLMILHHSQPSNDVTAYKAMETAVGEGKLRSIGLSNYYTPSDFDRLVNATTITPALLQNETHPYHQSKEMKAHLKQYGTVMESWFPLGGRGNTTTLFNDETISSIAAAHNKTSAQVILRWHLQAGNIAIPGSSNEAHIAENYNIFDFKLTDEEMQRLTDIDKNTRFASY